MSAVETSFSARDIIITASERPLGFTLWTLAVVTVLPPLLLFLVYRFCGRSAQRCNNVKVFAFANHKGGVGKSAVSLFAAKALAAMRPDTNILVVDCSVYTDLTAALVGDEGFSTHNTERVRAAGASIDSARSRLLTVARSWFRSFDHRQYMRPVRDFNPRAPANLFVMTNKGDKSSEGAKSSDSAQTISVIANDLRRALDRSGSPWVVLIDTDGGTEHNLTILGLCMSDHVVVPCDADIKGLRRITVMLDTLAALRRHRLSFAKVTRVFFNTQAQPASNDADQELGLNFTAKEETRRAMLEISHEFERLSRTAKYRAILVPDEVTNRANGAPTFFKGLRHGGVTWHRTMRDPFSSELSAAVDADLATLFRDLDHLSQRRLNLDQ